MTRYTYISAQEQIAALTIKLSDKAFMTSLYYQAIFNHADKDNTFIVINVT
jgi:hypothetical protein